MKYKLHEYITGIPNGVNEVIICNHKTRRIYLFNETASFIIRNISDYSTGELIDLLQNNYSSIGSQIENDTLSFLDSLLRDEIVFLIEK